MIVQYSITKKKTRNIFHFTVNLFAISLIKMIFFPPLNSRKTYTKNRHFVKKIPEKSWQNSVRNKNNENPLPEKKIQLLYSNRFEFFLRNEFIDRGINARK